MFLTESWHFALGIKFTPAPEVPALSGSDMDRAVPGKVPSLVYSSGRLFVEYLLVSTTGETMEG